ncbi:MAG TPA: hypothetical protein VF692_01255, partial [Pyrinomonadaceae bacterium]
MKNYFLRILLLLVFASSAMAQFSSPSGPKYLGKKAIDPPTPCSIGAYYFNTATFVYKYCNGSSVWTAWSGSGGSTATVAKTEVAVSGLPYGATLGTPSKLFGSGVNAAAASFYTVPASSKLVLSGQITNPNGVSATVWLNFTRGGNTYRVASATATANNQAQLASGFVFEAGDQIALDVTAGSNVTYNFRAYVL